jgi:hypothetical protein
MVREIVEARASGGHRLLLTFRSGECREVDLASFVTFDGVLEPLRVPQYFSTVRVDPDLGTVVWPNGVDFCPDVLYERGVAAGSHAV